MNFYFKIISILLILLILSVYTSSILLKSNENHTITLFSKLTNRYEISQSLYFFENENNNVFYDFENIRYIGKNIDK